MSRDEVFVLTSGSYSDYRVHCVVRGKKAKAKALAARANAANDRYGEAYTVETLPVVDADVQRVEVLSLRAEIRDTGTVEDGNPHYRIEWPFDGLYDHRAASWRWVRAPVHKGLGGRLEVSGTDHELVRKIYGDKRAVLLADDAMRACTELKGVQS